MRLNFVAPSTRRPSGGVAVIYEWASTLAARGHEVHLYHADFLKANVTRIDDIDWFTFSPEVEHHFPGPGDLDLHTLVPADFFFGYESETAMPPYIGLPIVPIQGYRMIAEESERYAYSAPCPKLCVASWLAEVGLAMGVPAQQLVHIPLGLRHETYRQTRPLHDRPVDVSFCYSRHISKRSGLALEVVDAVKRRRPELAVTVFGAEGPPADLPAWVRYRANPPLQELIDDIYNATRVFLCTSDVEGFGLTSIEAMACGAALVTTDNGGARDYARHDDTALMVPTGDAAALADQVCALLADDDRRGRIAQAGRREVQRFDWNRTAEQLEAFLERYRADPVAYGRPTTRVAEV